MEQCPTCNAIYKGERVCHRCKTELDTLLDIEEEAEIHLEKAISAFQSKDFGQMFFHANRSCTLHQTPKGTKVLACAAVLMRKFALAARLWSLNGHDQINHL